MSESIKDILNKTLVEIIGELAGDKFSSLPVDRCVFGPPKQPEHGDFATSAPLILTKPLGQPPFDLATRMAEAFEKSPIVARAEPARPGFVNLQLSPAGWAVILDAIATEGENFGTVTTGASRRVLLEFVSANPTGPMHLGHCRHAAVGDSLARIFSAAGYEVTKEFYINDAGVQIIALGESFRARCLAKLGDPLDLEAVQYPGEYLAEFAEDFVAGKDPALVRSHTVEDFSTEARGRNLDVIRQDLAALGVFFDHYQSEKELHDANLVTRTLESLESAGAVYEKDDALWLRTEDFGDDKDRVLRKGDGTVTYLVPDLAYHHYKFERGFDLYINLFGADHAGYPPRLRAGINALGHDASKLEVLLLRLVFLTKGGQRVKFSKRAGNFVAMSDVVAEAGSDATRWFMLARSMDSEFEFDMDLATDSSSNNPVYKVQYAHARVMTMMQKASEEAALLPELDSKEAAAALTAPIEKEIIVHLSKLPEIVERSAQERAVHHIPNYLLSLAELWNRYYSMGKTDPSFRILAEENRALAPARLRLADATRRVLANGLALMGISAPDSMTRQVSDEDE
ncbi:MAG: arginine--tRNA ligase [Candidatus Sumerlaeia bacterium]|nr:arginine--tRNA ligase [Candidatus Sumerlaeia bacterium]